MKKLLIKVIIHLTSEKFSIFVLAIAALVAWWGVCIDNERVTGYGGLVFIIGFTPWAIRATLRDIRQDRLGVGKDW